MMISPPLFRQSGKILLILGFLLLFHGTYAQEKCGTVPYGDLLKEKNLLKENQSGFENWLQSRLTEKRIRESNTMSIFSEAVTYTIPVVVHIIHNGETIGQGANLSMNRILSQIQALNEDFRRQNKDTTNTPAIFKGSATDTKIEFVLAKRDPEGLPTNGVTRAKGSKESYALNDNWLIKSHSYWPAEDYLNIWVAPLSGQLMGFAQFPQSTTQPGLEDASANRLTDGVVIAYEYFGINETLTPISKGRTATHEIGHFLGLRHIWGDGGCNQDDYCEDTPNADKANYGCPSGEVISCGNSSMYQNFMDYTDDGCMNLFTFNQMERMHVVLQNSPRRSSLIVSKAGEAPETVAYDLGIKKIIAPYPIICDNAIEPELLIKNYGSQDISSFKLLFTVNNDTVDSLYQSINLQPMDSLKVSFPTYVLSDTSDFLFDFYIKEVNEAEDGNPDNNHKGVLVHLPVRSPLPFYEDFEDTIHVGTIVDPDERLGWEVTSAPDATETNMALGLASYDYSADAGEQDFFFTDIFDLIGYKTAQLTFRIAYAQYSRASREGFKVMMSTDCGLNYHSENILFEQYGSELATAQRTTSFFIPSGRLEWKEITIDLSSYVEKENLRLAFVGINDYGNNIYLDDIHVFGETEPTRDLRIIDVAVPPVACNTTFVPKVYIVNQGLTPISSFILNAYSVWEENVSLPYVGPEILPLDTIVMDLPLIDAAIGPHSLSIHIKHPGELADKTPENNFKSITFIVDTVYEELPFREQFHSKDIETFNWFVYNPDNNTTWERTNHSHEGDEALFLNHFNYSTIGEKDWLISPLMNFADFEFLRLTFMISYGHNFNYKDRLQVLVSTDCGLSYSNVAYDAAGEDIASNYVSSEWIPSGKTSWNKISIPLDGFIGEENVRIAFVMNNGYGNNLYLDDIEFFVSEEPEEPLPSGVFFTFPNPTVNGMLPITFNLEEKEDAHIALYDLRGRILYKGSFPGTLNQTYQIDLSTLPEAVYLLKVSSVSFNKVQRILLRK